MENTWLPIETYDRLKKKPKNAVFVFSAVNANDPYRMNLPQLVGLSRHMGLRTCILWMPLPEIPVTDSME